MDPLSDVLSLVTPHSYSFRGFEADGAWSIQFGQGEGIGRGSARTHARVRAGRRLIAPADRAMLHETGNAPTDARSAQDTK